MRPAAESRDLEQSTIEKGKAIHHEYSCNMSQDDVDFLESFSDKRKEIVIRKIDLRLLPVLILLYLMAYLDKTNIGNAKIEGMTADLNMHGIMYNVAVAIFFIPFILFEVPSNMILHKVPRPSVYMGGIVIAWGIIMTLTGIVQSYAGLLATRFLLGIFEAGFLPGAILIISNWYLPQETQVRIAILYTSAATGGAFSGLLAFAIGKMDGIAGLDGWRWIFILEGIFTVTAGALCFLMLCDSPALSTRWLDADEIRYLELRQLARRPGIPRDNAKKHFNLAIFKDILCDYKIYLLAFANWSNAVPNYAMKFTMPTILTSMGIPGDIFLVGPQTCVVVAFSALYALSSDIKNNVAAAYFAICLSMFGLYPILPGVNAWNIANTPDPTKRSISIGLLVCIGNIGGLIGSYIYLDREAPRYPTGYGTSLTFATTGIVAATLLEFLLRRSNQKKALMTDEEVRERYTEEEMHHMGEKSPLFKYAL
ncbi:Major facilitator superfamily transporter [Cordyceps militaris CM01]|uniref:Major facilitator superfamily transporter n=1 Tax=Cordyceps militaris (strain CM01) TaxID=983644 RepID=G3JT56_CORMM|nr:Major facilitator superfamily transporter [Cordyceps militaris CM01]EGX88203.1 Major facilitator superfamily transporter [Cordyceps militaris CM01]